MKKLKSTTVYGTLFVLFAIYSLISFGAFAENESNTGIALMGIFTGSLALGMYIAYTKAQWEQQKIYDDYKSSMNIEKGSEKEILMDRFHKKYK